MLTAATLRIITSIYRKYKDTWLEKHFRNGKYVRVEVDDLIIEAVIRITPKYDDMVIDLVEEDPDHE